MSAPTARRQASRPIGVPPLQLSHSPTSARVSGSETPDSTHSRSNSYSAQALNLTRQGLNKSAQIQRVTVTEKIHVNVDTETEDEDESSLSSSSVYQTAFPDDKIRDGDENDEDNDNGDDMSASGASVKAIPSRPPVLGYDSSVALPSAQPSALTQQPQPSATTDLTSNLNIPGAAPASGSSLPSISTKLNASTNGYDTAFTTPDDLVKAAAAPATSASVPPSEQPMTEELCSPADLEGHVGLDGRFYLLDFSRTQPPEQPNRNFKNGHLSRLLRPEFVRSYLKPLCSDAFSGFIKGTPGEQEHNADIEEATRQLIEVTVPKFARELELSMAEAREQGRLNKFRITEFAHSHGINCRHFGRLRMELRDPDFRRLILLEMIARCIKNNLRWKLREKMKQIALPLEEPYRRLVIDYFNLVFGNTRISEDYWNNWLKKDLEVNFVNCLLASESAPTFNLKKGYANKIDDDFLYQLFERVTTMMGMTWGFGPSRTSNFLSDMPFDDTDLEAIGERVKHMNIIAHAQGYFYHLKGLAIRIDDPLGAQKFYEIAIERFEDALNTDPNNKEILLSMALTHMLAIEDIYANVPNARFLPSDQRVMKAEEYCLRAIYAQPKYDSFSLFRYAQFLEKTNRVEAAEDYYLMALEADPNNAGCLHSYGQLLTDRGEHDLAEKFFKRASANTVGLKQWPQWYH